VKNKLKLLSLSTLLSSAVLAQEIKLETPYKVPSEIEENTSVSQIISSEDIQEKHPEFVLDVLKTIPEISFSSNGGFGQPTAVYLRGFDSKRTLVLLDGIRINDVTGLTGAQFEHLMLEDIKKIEIIEGEQSGVWGADASAGVINIITETPEKGIHSKILVETGSFWSSKYGLSLSYRDDRYYVLASYYKFYTKGFSAAEPTKSSPNYGKRGDELGYERDGYRNGTSFIKAGVFLDEENKVEILMRGIDAKVHFDAAAGVDAKDIDDPFGFGTAEYFNKIHNKFYRAEFNHKDIKNDFKIYYNYSIFKRSQFGGYSGNVGEFGIQDKYKYSKNGFAVFGFVSQDFKHKKSAGFNLDRSYTDNGIFITNVNRFNKNKTVITESLRKDNYDEFQDKTTGKLGIKHYIKKQVYVSANYGTAYNIPTLYQLFDGFVGNPNLKPEDVKGYDLSFNYKNFSITYFYNEIENLIDFDLGTYKYKNISGKSKIKGVEAGYKRYFTKTNINFYLGYAYLDAKDGNGKRLLRRPQNKLNLELGWYPTDKFNMILDGQYIGQRKDLNGVETGYYSVFDLVLNYDLTRNAKFYLKVNNLTDKYYQTVDGYATAERSYFAGITAKF
jgi:vitamin B12 transporter